MEFRRITNLPPYVFTIINGLKIEARRAGADVIDLGFGNPDIPSPEIAVEKLAEAARNTRNHRYSASRGIPSSARPSPTSTSASWGVDLDPETEIINTIGAKEGFCHLMWVLLAAGRRRARAAARQLPDPHLRPAVRRRRRARGARCGTDADFFESLETAWQVGWPKPRVLVISFPHNPTTACVDLDFMQRLVDFARENEVIVVHDFAYADVGFDGYEPPSILQAEGAKECAVELYSMTKSFSMAGWRVAFLVGQRRGRGGAGEAQDATSTTARSSRSRSRRPSR